MIETPHFIILAAGLGSRFRQGDSVAQHKALAPVWDQRGTLELTLGHLKALQNHALNITIATGYLAETVERHARQIAPEVGIFYNDGYADDTMLQTLEKVASALPEQQGFWVLFADTLYSRQALQLMQSHRHCQPTVAIMRRQSESQAEVGLSLKADGSVAEFRSPEATHQMAHAVYWPSAEYWRSSCGAWMGQPNEGKPLTSQWQLLQHIDAVATLTLPDHASEDLDTPEQLRQLKPPINATILSYFSDNLNKDRRSLVERDSRLQDQYVKQCESVPAAAHEARVLRLINERLPEFAPELTGVEGRVIRMRLASGIRLYDLLRQLSGSPEHERIRATLKERCGDRLAKLQPLLKESSITSDPYPFDVQVSELLRVLCMLLRLPPPPEHELAALASEWQVLCTVPFRDATPKNIIVADPIVCASLDPTQRREAVGTMLRMPEAYWQQVSLQDIDFTSTCHLSSPQDDWLSLLGHAVNFPDKHLRWPSACLPLCDVTLLVRYLRFGGRKLIYKLVNPTGFQVRFRYDEPCFYFVGLCAHLSEAFGQDYPELMKTLYAIRDKAERYRGVTLSGSNHDPYLSTLSEPPRYWQESPLEMM